MIRPEQFKCIKTVIVDDDELFTEGVIYTELYPDIWPEVNFEGHCLKNNYGDEHFIGPLSESWSREHFEMIEP